MIRLASSRIVALCQVWIRMCGVFNRADRCLVVEVEGGVVEWNTLIKNGQDYFWLAEWSDWG